MASPSTRSRPAAPTADLGQLMRWIEAEVVAGPKNEGKKYGIDEARENQAFFDRDSERYIPARESESPLDRRSRPKRISGFMRECVEVLTDDLYGSGPSRTFDAPAGQEFLERVWADNMIDALLQRCDELAHVNDLCAIQVDAGEGDYERCPVEYRVWGREEFVYWTHPDDYRKLVALCTIEEYDLTTRYRLWTDESVKTFVTEKAEGTSGGRVAKLAADEANTYGVIPFGFFWYDIPIRSFQSCGVGTFLRKAEARINDRLSLLDFSCGQHLDPFLIAKNVPDDWAPVVYSGNFLKLNGRGPTLGPDGYGPPKEPTVESLKVQPDIAGTWDDLMRFVNQVLEAARVPLSAVRMETTGTMSGIALMAEALPLAKRARRRRAPAYYSESHLARVTLLAAGNHYGRPELADAAESGRLALGWPEPTIPIPGPDRDQANQAAMEMGVKSRLQIIQETYSCSREQALQILKQIAKDRADEEAIDPMPAGAKQPPDDLGETGEDEDESGNEDETDPEEGSEDGESRGRQPRSETRK